MSKSSLPVSRTKVIVPQLRPEIIRRSRLLALFNDLLDKKLILITAPAGYGKTTLLIDFANWTEMPICWLSLDTLDKDPQRFITYLIAAISERFPQFGRMSNIELNSATNLEMDSERLLSSMVNEIYDQIDEHFSLIIDDYHLVDPVPGIREFLSRFISLAGENCHIVLASRRLPTLPDIALMVARQQVGGFDLEQLAFSRQELEHLLEKSQGIKPRDEVVEQLLHQTEGWITGLILSISQNDQPEPFNSDQGQTGSKYHTTRIPGMDLAAYFNQQILNPLSADLRSFLLQTSLLDEFDVDLCNAVLGVGHWGEWIESVRKNNIFILQVGPDGKWLRYHSLFQEFLKETIRREDPELAREILVSLAEVYEENGEWEKAHAIYQQFSNVGLLAGLIERAGSPLLLSERLVTLADWLDELPANLVRESPSLLSLKGALLCGQGDSRSALKLLNEAIPALQKTQKNSDLSLAYVRRAAANRLVGDHSSSLQDTDVAIQLSENKLEMRATHAEAELFRGISLSFLGRMPEAIQTLESALRHYEQLSEPQSVARVQMCLGDAYQSINDYSSARNAYQQCLSEWQNEDNFSLQANALNSLGVLSHHQGEYIEAVQYFEEGLERARRCKSPWREAILLTSLGDIFFDLDEFQSAGQAYSNAFDTASRINYQFLINYIHLALARMARVRGQIQEAHFHLAKAETNLQIRGSTSEQGRFYMEQGCLNLVENKLDSGFTNLERAMDLFQQSSQVIETNSCHIWQAAISIGRDDPKSARSHLKMVLNSLPTAGIYSPTLQDLRRAFPWLSRFRSDNEFGALLTSWLESATGEEQRLPSLRHQLRPLLASIQIEAQHLVIQGFGKAQVWVDGELIPSTRWKTNSVRELFFFFLSRKRPISKDEIGEILWPGSEPRQMKLRFKNDLYRLRHALGGDVILYEENQYSFNRLVDFDYDIENFEGHLSKAKLSETNEDKKDHLLAAATLRQGPYLMDMDATWILAERESLDQICLETLNQLVELQNQTGDYSAALQSCQQALNIDPCREDVHRMVMQLHARKGDRLAVVWQYQLCRETLRRELDVNISEETEALYRRLVA